MNRRTFLTQLAGTGATTAGGIAITGSARGQGTTHTIGMYTKGGSFYFDPIGLYVKPGDTVKWVLKSGGHSTTSYTKGNPSYNGPRLIPKNAKPWDSGVLNKPGASFSYTFQAKGTYLYYCIPQKEMTAGTKNVVSNLAKPQKELAEHLFVLVVQNRETGKRIAFVSIQ